MRMFVEAYVGAYFVPTAHPFYLEKVCAVEYKIV